MNFSTYFKKFEEGARKAGYSANQIKVCLEYAENLFQNNVPVIYNSDHLAVLVGYNKSYLKRAVSYPKYFYRKFYIKKKKGGKRLLLEPLPSLKEIQNWILENILYKYKTHPYAKAYVPGVSIKDNIKYHKKKDEVLALDIIDFFGSISYAQVNSIFREVGYAPIISDLLTKLVTMNGTLAQGAPTSPYISNLVMRNFDLKLEQYSKEHKLMFTRYADDLTFSGKAIQTDKVIEAVAEQLEPLGLSINLSKTRHMPKNKRQMVTGVVVNEKAQIPRSQRKLIRQEVYYIQKFGIHNHMARRGIDKGNYLKHLLGKINFSLFINPNDSEMMSYKKFLVTLI